MTTEIIFLPQHSLRYTKNGIHFTYKPKFRSIKWIQQLLSKSKSSQFMELEGSLLHSEKAITVPFPEPGDYSIAYIQFLLKPTVQPRI